MSWLYSQVLVEEYLGDISLDGEQSVQSNGKPTQQAYLSQDKMTKYSRLSRFGMMYKPLTENLGEELLMLYLEDFHARTYQQPEKEEELKPKEVECGERWQGLLARLDPNTHLWKIPQCSLLEDSEQSLETWPRWGTMQNGVCWDMTHLEVSNAETESGLLPTPTKNLFSHWSSAKAKVLTNGIRKSGVKVGSILWWDMTEQHIRLGGLEEKTIPDPLCGEVVMEWPMGWTELQPLEMDKFQEWQQQHGQS